MKITSFICLVSCICLFACQDSPKESIATYDIGLAESKKIVLPVDENTYFLSKSIFQFEEDGKEYLHFENSRKACTKSSLSTWRNKKFTKGFLSNQRDRTVYQLCMEANLIPIPKTI